jgi:hypothetical protein
VDVEFDPRSSDFGKIKIGNTRIDPLSGLSQATVFASRLATGKTKTISGEVHPGRYPDTITQFLRSKLAPIPATLLDLRTGKNFAGEPITLPSTVLGLVEPLVVNDIYDAMKESGVPAGAALGTLSIFGDSIQTYSPKIQVPSKAGSTLPSMYPPGYQHGRSPKKKMFAPPSF